jgi:prepilin-type N-terminal cleavage/methylation domain-containing protein
MTRRASSRDRGLTIIEVVVATAMLAISASMIVGALSFSGSIAARNRQKLNAAEVAHRIIITHIRDRRELVGQPKRVEFDGTFYRFDIDEDVLVQDQGDGTGPNRRTAKKTDDVTLEQRLSAQIYRVTVAVYLDTDRPEGARPLVTISRVFNAYFGLDEDELLDRLKQEFGTQLDR